MQFLRATCSAFTIIRCKCFPKRTVILPSLCPPPSAVQTSLFPLKNLIPTIFFSLFFFVFNYANFTGFYEFGNETYSHESLWVFFDWLASNDYHIRLYCFCSALIWILHKKNPRTFSNGIDKRPFLLSTITTLPIFSCILIQRDRK